MVTAQTIVSAALRASSSASPGEAIEGGEAENALDVLNRLMRSWSARDLMVPYRTLESFSLPAGTGSRTIGPGAQLDTVRPDEVTGMYLRDSANIDRALDPMPKEVYNAIPLKNVSAWPLRYYYDNQYPNGIIYFDLVTDRVFTLFLETLKPVNQFATLQTSMALPPEYEEPIIYLVAHRLCVENGYPITPDLAALIEEAEPTIMRKNVKLKRAGFDPALSRRRTRAPSPILTG